jgi:hypothetical protein
MTAAARNWSFLAPTPAPPVRFEGRAGDREAALMGVIEVGQIGPCPPGGLFYWRLWLPGGPSLGRASSPKAARDHLTSRVEQWIEAADLKSVKA